MMSDPNRNNNLDRRANDWLDAADADATSPEAGRSIDTEDESTQKEIADLLLVDALLANMADGAEDQHDQRIERVMSAIQTPQPTGILARRSMRWITIAAVAASFLTAAAVLSIQLSRSTLANDVLSAVNRASSAATDRAYSIHRHFTHPRKETDSLPRGTLYLRGREGFVVVWGDAVLGRANSEFWLVENRQKVTLAESFAWIESDSANDELSVSILQELSLRSQDFSLMQLASVAELMQHDYRVKLQRTTLDGQPIDLLSGSRESANGDLPERIRLWADTQSRVIQRAELHWGPENSLSFELLPTTEVPFEWYDYLHHCDANPNVRRISSN